MLDALRLCKDYRKANKLTVKNSSPLPRIQDMGNGLGKAKYFASLDLLMDYDQISVRDEDRPKTAFLTQRPLCLYLHAFWFVQSSCYISTFDGYVG